MHCLLYIAPMCQPDQIIFDSGLEILNDRDPVQRHIGAQNLRHALPDAASFL